MDLAWISLAALLVVIVVSCTTAVNPGVLSVTLAGLIGIYIAPHWGSKLVIKDVIAGFPGDLFLTLVGVTLLFTQSNVNGTLGRLSRIALSLCRGNVGLMPIMFFLITAVLSAVGAGNIAAAALVAPMAMAVADRVRIPPFLMTIMVAHGSLAGALSPFTPTGIIANDLMRDKMGLTGVEIQNFGYNLAANLAVALTGYLLFGGWKLFARGSQSHEWDVGAVDPEVAAIAREEGVETVRDLPTAIEPRQWGTLAVIAGLLVGVIFFRVHLGFGAFAGATILAMCGWSDEHKSFRMMPWSVIVMVCGVTVLTSLLEKTGGIDLFAHLVSQVATPTSATGVMAFLTGIVSVYSSTSGVVLPTFLPMVSRLVAEMGGGDPLRIALSVIVGGHLVDSSPLSTIGALCIASTPVTIDRRKLFNQVLIWGLSMSVVGAILCYVLFGLF